MNELALFAGAGGGILSGKLLGWRTVCAVECDAYAAFVLAQRQNDGCLNAFPIWSDVRSFDGRPWRGIVDVVSGGFPCQDISAAGKGAGITGERSGLWTEMARIIGEVRPRYAFVENSPMLISRGLTRVLGDLAEMGYDARWGIIGAHHVGAPHKRDRIWIVANSDNTGQSPNQGQGQARDNSGRCCADVADTDSCLCNGGANKQGRKSQKRTTVSGCGDGFPNTEESRLEGEITAGQLWKHNRLSAERCTWWTTEPDVGRVAHRVAARVDRLKCIGNGQVPAVAALAWEILTQEDNT